MSDMSKWKVLNPNVFIGILIYFLVCLVSKVNLSVHEDKNRVPYVKVSVLPVSEGHWGQNKKILYSGKYLPCFGFIVKGWI